MSPGIREIVTSEKADVVNTGAVKDAEGLSASTLTQKERVAGQKTVIASGPKHGVPRATLRGKASAADGLDGLEAGNAGRPAVNGRRKPPKLERLKAEAGSIAASAVMGQIDDSDELSGSQRIYEAARAGRRIASRAKKAKAAESSPGKSRAAATSAKAPSAKAKNGAAKVAPSRSESAVALPDATAQIPTVTAKVPAAESAIAGSATAAAPVAGIVAGILAFVIVMIAVGQIAGAVFGFWDNESKKQSLAGLSPYITYEMVEAALAAQDEYGHPAGCTIAQIIVESGQGDHMSRLAERDHNLFGMKWAASFAAAPEVTGKANWVTGEEVDGAHVTITDSFTVFRSDADCIRFRSRVFLASPTYSRNALIIEAASERSSDKMAEGLKDAGWATDSSYVEKLKSVMDQYGLRALDSMAPGDLGSPSGGKPAIVAAAFSQLGVPYV